MSMKHKKWPIRYRRTTVKVSFNPRSGRCVVFGHRANKTDRHHWRYAYPTEKVKLDPALALDNSVEVCFRHHLLGNSLKDFYDYSLEETLAMVFSMDVVSRLKFKQRLIQVLKAMERSGK